MTILSSEDTYCDELSGDSTIMTEIFTLESLLRTKIHCHHEEIFGRVRKRFGIDNNELVAMFSSLDVNWDAKTLAEIVPNKTGAGASASEIILPTGTGGKVIAKSLDWFDKARVEAANAELPEFLDKYRAHHKQYPASLLPRFYAIFSFQADKKKTWWV